MASLGVTYLKRSTGTARRTLPTRTPVIILEGDSLSIGTIKATYTAHYPGGVPAYAEDDVLSRAVAIMNSVAPGELPKAQHEAPPPPPVRETPSCMPPEKKARTKQDDDEEVVPSTPFPPMFSPPRPGVPGAGKKLPAVLRSMLSEPRDEVYVETKWDGWRVIIDFAGDGNVRVRTKTGLLGGRMTSVCGLGRRRSARLLHHATGLRRMASAAVYRRRGMGACACRRCARTGTVTPTARPVGPRVHRVGRVNIHIARSALRGREPAPTSAFGFREHEEYTHSATSIMAGTTANIASDGPNNIVVLVAGCPP